MSAAKKCDICGETYDVQEGTNADNLTEAVHGLDIFTKNWCMNCAETEKTNDLVFNCENCEFKTIEDICLIKKFVKNHKHDYYIPIFGSMGEL